LHSGSFPRWTQPKKKIHEIPAPTKWDDSVAGVPSEESRKKEGKKGLSVVKEKKGRGTTGGKHKKWGSNKKIFRTRRGAGGGAKSMPKKKRRRAGTSVPERKGRGKEGGRGRQQG